MTAPGELGDVRKVLALAGVSDRVAAGVCRELSLLDVADLRRAAENRRLHSLRGMNLSMEYHILRCLDELSTAENGTLMDVARFQADEVLGWLSSQEGVLRAEPVGAMRRGEGIVSEVEFLAATLDGQGLLQAFARSPLARRLRDKTKEKVQVLTDLGTPVTLFVSEPDHYGASLLVRTGSRDHLRMLEVLSDRKRRPFAEVVALGGVDEEAIYGLLGLPLIPPSLRQGLGEIEAAMSGELPHLIHLDDIQGDLHIHSRWADGLDSIASLAESAVARGYEYIAISDHSPLLAEAEGLDSARLHAQAQEIIEHNRRYQDLVILRSLEVDIRATGELDMPDECLLDLDLVIASIHLGYDQDRETITHRLMSAIEHPLVDVVAHPTGGLLKRQDLYRPDTEALLRAAARTGVALEINAGPDRLDLSPELARKAKALGVPLVISSDAHCLSHLSWMQFGVAAGRQAWLEAEDVLNTMPLQQMRARLKRNRPGGAGR